MYERIVDERVPVGFRAYDGSTAGPMDAEMLLEIRRPEAIAYIATAPGELGLVRAYVTGALEIHGDIHTAIHALVTHVKPVPWSERLAILRALGPQALRRPVPPPEEAPPPWRRGLRHSRQRDAAAISHHYDVSPSSHARTPRSRRPSSRSSTSSAARSA
jgi:cyclopropane-fatty-acyl-phospholipid synthase